MVPFSFETMVYPAMRPHRNCLDDIYILSAISFVLFVNTARGESSFFLTILLYGINGIQPVSGCYRMQDEKGPRRVPTA